MIKNTVFKPLPRPVNVCGEARRIGFELEFSGVSLDQATEVVAKVLGGDVIEPSLAERTLEYRDGARFTITIDWDFLTRTASEHAAEGRDTLWLEGLRDTAARLVPIEVVCPPLEVDELATLQHIVVALREAGAVGTNESLVAAYGTHINVEPPALDAPTIARYLQAFSLLQEWLVEAHQVDMARRLSTYVALYPEAYTRELFLRTPDKLDALMVQYLEYNASRNRALDMLPLLAEHDEASVTAAVKDGLVRSRPALHYRLPNCAIEQPGWSLALEWNRWLVVERLAADRAAINTLSAEYLDTFRPVLGLDIKAWVNRIAEWLDDRGWA